MTERHHKRTVSNNVPHKGLWAGAEHHVDQPEGVKDLDAHPGQGRQQSVVESSCHPHTHALASNVGQHAGEEEEQVEKEKRKD